MYQNHFRMVEGPPLWYSSHSTVFPFFQKFDNHGCYDMSEELLVAHSPNSTQSDSDNSLSSTEAPFAPIRPPVIRTIEKNNEDQIRCCWKSCGINFKTLDELANHVTKSHASSGPDGLFYCGWEGCLRNNRGFNARYKMLVHVRTHTNEKPHRCEKCSKSFSRAENLKIHLRSHSGEKPYLCPVPGCNKAYSNSSDRFKHTRTHQVEKPYKCKVPGCPKRYTDPSSLRKHVKTYKHFPETEVTEKSAVVKEKRPEKVMEEMNVVLEEKVVEEKVGYKIEPYGCIQACCGGISKDLFGLSAYFEGNEGVTWSKYGDLESGRYYGAFGKKQERGEMDIEMPLDLSVSRKQFS